MKAPSGDMLPARGAAKVMQSVVLNNPNKVGLMQTQLQLSKQGDTSLFGVTFSVQQWTLLNPHFCIQSQTLDLSRSSPRRSRAASKSFLLLQVNMKMRVRISYSRQGSAFQDTIQIDSFPGLGSAGHWQRPSGLTELWQMSQQASLVSDQSLFSAVSLCTTVQVCSAATA